MSELLVLMHGDAVDEAAADWPAYLDGLAHGGPPRGRPTSAMKAS